MYFIYFSRIQDVGIAARFVNRGRDRGGKFIGGNLADEFAGLVKSNQAFVFGVQHVQVRRISVGPDVIPAIQGRVHGLQREILRYAFGKFKYLTVGFEDE